VLTFFKLLSERSCELNKLKYCYSKGQFHDMVVEMRPESTGSRIGLN
jgi:hypothetical protein